MKLWRAVITGGLPKCKEKAGGTKRAPKSQSLPRPFSPRLYLNFENIFPTSLPADTQPKKGADSPTLQLAMRTWCNEGSRSCQVPGSPSSPLSIKAF